MTKIDEFLMTIALDATGVKKGVAETKTATESLRADAVKTAQEIEDQNKRMADAISAGVKKGVSDSLVAHKKVRDDDAATKKEQSAAAKKLRDEETRIRKEKDAADKASRAAAAKAAKETDEQNRRTAEGLSHVRDEVIAMGAAFLGASAIKGFVEKITTLDAATGRAAHNLGVSSETLSTWEGIAKRVGATTDDMRATFESLNNTFQNLRAHRQTGASEWLRAIFQETGRVIDINKDLGETIFDLADTYKELQRKVGTGQANFQFQQLGIPQSIINLLQKDKSVIADWSADQKKLNALNDADTQAADDRARAWHGLADAMEGVNRAIVNNVSPAMIDVLDTTKKWIEENKGLTTGIEVLIGLFVGAKFLAAMKAIQGFRAALTGGAAVAAGGAIATPLAIGALLGTAAGIGALTVGKWIGGKINDHWLGGGAPSGGSGATASAGNQSDVAAFEAMGWSHENAAAIAANISAESGGNPNARNGSHFGLAQWDLSRQADFAAWARTRGINPDIHLANTNQQRAFINYELREGKFKGIGDRLARTSSAGAGAALLSTHYEIPNDPFGSIAASRASLGEAFARADPGLAVGASSAIGSTITNNTRSNSSDSSSATHNNTVGPVNITVSGSSGASVGSDIADSLLARIAATANYSLN